MNIDDDRQEAISRLKRLESQVRSAIDYIQSGMPLFPIDRLENPNDTPNTIHIGDFTITDRFIEPH